MSALPVDKLVSDYLVEYGAYDNATRGAVGLDGLKHVYRRVLISLYQIGRDKYIKAAQLIGHTMSHYHPHSDISIYGAIVKMVHNGMILGQGNFGSLTGLDPSLTKEAAPRYPEVKWNPELDMDMTYIKFADMVDTELGDGQEPKFIPARLPFCLVRRKRWQLLAQGIGVGLKSNYLHYRPNDLVEHCLEKSKANIRPYLGPDISISIKNGIVIAKPKLEINKDKKQIIIKSNIGNIKKALDQLESDITILDLSTPSYTKIIVEIKPYKRLTIDKLVKTIEKYTTVKLREQIYVSMDNKLYHLTLCDWVKMLFDYRVECASRFYNDKIDKLNRKIRALNLIRIIRPYISKAAKESVDSFISTIRSKKKIQKALQGFTDQEIRDIITTYKISTLITCDVDTEKLEAEVRSIKNIIDNIDNIVLAELKS